ncbi:class I adenylate-forming enzyme family protein [Ruegeria sp. HKCCD7255]|uniref:class I adenylate-forming enzyme family protein n=1 Tax=Ruegeria sp. HKCCD7255 TaxID=2683004 RepID=UPI001488C6CD|nr:class I adenylate-forming enzyme family protein [Ruegeria sp. HKCCD7255]
MLSVFDHGPADPCPAPFNLAAHVLRRADQNAGKTALSVLGPAASEDWNYAQLKAAILGTGTGLLRAGLNPGDIVLMRLGNTVDFPIAYLGAIAVGIVPVPTSSQLTEAETAQMISDLAPAAILRDPLVACAPHPNEISVPALQAMRDLPPAAFDLGDPDRMAYVVYTSGTSGKPRAVAHAHRAIWARQMMVDGWYALRPEDRLCHAGAFNWTYTLGTGLMDPWTIGATALIPAPGTEITTLPDLLRAHRATIFAAAPGVYRKMLQRSDFPDLPELRHGLSAGEKLAHSLRAAWHDTTGTAIYEAYGMSECSTFISFSPAHPARGDALGQPQPGRRIAILGEDGPVPQGQEGTIAIHRDDPGLMLTYLNAPDEAEARLMGDWFLTGDQGAMAIDGQITYLGRDDDMMNAGGYRVSPVEVESALSQHPGITQVGAAAVEVRPDTFVIAAFYTGPEELDADALDTYVSQRLARYKQPRAYVHLPALPTGGNGKLLRRALPAYFKATPK